MNHSEPEITFTKGKRQINVGGGENRLNYREVYKNSKKKVNMPCLVFLSFNLDFKVCFKSQNGSVLPHGEKVPL